MFIRQQATRVSFVLVALASFLTATVANADFAISGEWFENRGPTVNLPPGLFDGPCGTNPFTVPKGTPRPITAMNQVAAPCVRHQVQVAPVGFAQKPQFGVPAPGQAVVATTATPTAVGAAFRIPANVFARNATSQVAVPGNPVVQQLDTTFNFNGPVATHGTSPNNLNTPLFTPGMAIPGQRPGIASQTRLMQPNAWSGPGQPVRTAANFNFSQFTGTVLSRQVSYTAGPNAFGGTMGMFLQGGGTVYAVADLVTGIPGNEVLVSPFGGGAGITQHMGRGYLTTQHRIGSAPGTINLNYNIPTPCTNAIPPSPVGCDLITGIATPIATLAAATTVNIGFPWTTGHVSAYVKGSTGGQPITSTLTAVGSDTTSGGVRTIQLVSGGVALRNSPISGLGRTAHIDIVTIQVPEPGSTMALVGALGLIGGLYGVRRRFF